MLLPWRRAVFLQKKAIQIQRIVRGMLGRKWVALWYNTRTNIIVCWQACTRRFNSNLRTRKLLAIDQQMAIRIQKIVRAKLARIKCRRLLEDMAATRIQILWRGVMGRVRADKSWIQKTVIPIQKIARRMIVVKKFRKSCEGYNHAATLIQKCFRSWRSYRAMGEKLWKRELDYRGDSVHMLQSDEDFSQEKLEKLIHRLTKTGMKEKAEDDLKRLLDYQNAVYRKENDLIEINRQLDILSPRAIKLGFKEELEKNRTALRAELTEMKSRCLFELSIEGNQKKATVVIQSAALLLFFLLVFSSHNNKNIVCNSLFLFYILQCTQTTNYWKIAWLKSSSGPLIRKKWASGGI